MKMDQESTLPADEGVILQPHPAAAPRFFVVSTPKFWIMYVGTFGLYGLYWMYKHWANLKRASNGDEWPLARAIFQIFFYHSLAREIDLTLRRGQIDYRWNPDALASTIVLFSIGSYLLGRMGQSWDMEPYASLLVFASIPGLAYFLQKIQRAANVACNDPDGLGNTQCTAVNFFWLALGALFWLLVIIGLLVGKKA
jgi:hypothetical protein